MDIKKLLQQKTELKEVWDYLAITAEYPDKQMRLWLLDYPKDMIESALMVLATKEDRVEDPVKFLAGVLRKSKERNMTPEERDEQISIMCSVIGKVGAANRHRKEIAAIKEDFAQVYLDLPEVCQTLPDFAKPSPTFAQGDCDGVGVGVNVSLSESVNVAAKLTEV